MSRGGQDRPGDCSSGHWSSDATMQVGATRGVSSAVVRGLTKLAASFLPGRRGTKLAASSTVARGLGAALIGTAVLKVLSPADAAALEAAYDLPRWLAVAAVQAELLVGALLIAGVAPRTTWNAALWLFFAFAAFSLYRAAAGYESCGCFGPVKVNPWATFLLDVAGVALILRWQPRVNGEGGRAASRRRALASLGCYAPVGAVALVWMTSTGAAVLDGPGVILGNDRLVIVEPDEWIGEPFPLTEHMSPKVDVIQGDWIILMYHHDCPKCQEALPKYEELAATARGRVSPKLAAAASEKLLHGSAGRVLLLEVPPYGDGQPSRGGQAIHARLSDEREWFVRAPVEIRLSGGNVASASLELPSIALP